MLVVEAALFLKSLSETSYSIITMTQVYGTVNKLIFKYVETEAQEKSG